MAKTDDAMARFELTLAVALDLFTEGLRSHLPPAAHTSDGPAQDRPPRLATRCDPPGRLAALGFDCMMPGALRRLLATGALPGLNRPRPPSPFRSPGNGRTERSA